MHSTEEELLKLITRGPARAPSTYKATRTKRNGHENVPTPICAGAIYPRLSKYMGIQGVLHSSIKRVSDVPPPPHPRIMLYRTVTPSFIPYLKHFLTHLRKLTLLFPIGRLADRPRASASSRPEAGQPPASASVHHPAGQPPAFVR
jgi:hypothetical protein